MDINEAIKLRHSVRAYQEKPIENELVCALEKEIDLCNKESGLHIQLVTNEKDAFDSLMAHYGKFSGVSNYISLIGKKGKDLDEKIGYYGQRIVLFAQTLGLNTCWVAMSYSKSKSKCTLEKGEKLVCTLALGYGKTQGHQRKSKPLSAVCKSNSEMPEWFKKGMEAALLAPTAINQQRFMFTLNQNEVKAVSTGGFYSKVDLGIVKYNFEAAAGKENFKFV